MIKMSKLDGWEIGGMYMIPRSLKRLMNKLMNVYSKMTKLGDT
jgi:hypothetical protein